jgi:flavin reductase (DIM6/NTAB) family NADH-FMN oxidoreductase RutF
VYLDLTDTDRTWRDIYRLCIGLVVPRPIALVSTNSPAGLPNLAPFSFANMVAANPPVFMFCPALRRDGSPKDTLENIRGTREFVVATVTEALVERAVRAGADLPAGQSEFDFAGLTPTPAGKVRPARVAESPVNFECRLRDIIELGTGPGGGNIVLGDILALHVSDDILGPDGLVDPGKYPAVGRLGGSSYTTVRDSYELEIPVVSRDPAGR